MKALSPESPQAAVCGALSCRESPEFVVRHPDYGRRTLCFDHAHDLLHRPVEQSTAGAEAERADASENRGTAEAGPLTRGPDPTRESPRSGASRTVESVLPDGTDGPPREGGAVTTHREGRER